MRSRRMTTMLQTATTPLSPGRPQTTTTSLGADDAIEGRALMSQSLDSEDDAADMLPKVTFSHLFRDYLADQKRQEDKAAIGGNEKPLQEQLTSSRS